MLTEGALENNSDRSTMSLEDTLRQPEAWPPWILMREILAVQKDLGGTRRWQQQHMLLQYWQMAFYIQPLCRTSEQI